MTTRPDFSQNTIERCKALLHAAYELQDEGIEPEAIMRMAIFISTIFSQNADIEPEEYADIIKDTWQRMFTALYGSEIEEESTEDLDPSKIWVSDKPITDQDQ